MTNQFPTPPRMPRIIRVPMPAILKGRSDWVRYGIGLVVVVGAIAALWAGWKWHSLHAGMPKLPSDMAEMGSFTSPPGAMIATLLGWRVMAWVNRGMPTARPTRSIKSLTSGPNIPIDFVICKMSCDDTDPCVFFSLVRLNRCLVVSKARIYSARCAGVANKLIVKGKDLRAQLATMRLMRPFPSANG